MKNGLGIYTAKQAVRGASEALLHFPLAKRPCTSRLQAPCSSWKMSQAAAHLGR